MYMYLILFSLSFFLLSLIIGFDDEINTVELRY